MARTGESLRWAAVSSLVRHTAGQKRNGQEKPFFQGADRKLARSKELFRCTIKPMGTLSLAAPAAAVVSPGCSCLAVTVSSPSCRPVAPGPG